ncbi:MAG: TonB-dependent receptor [Bacteroidia bacterium]|nr:TonB-dependent receptor [Bacteroidia bacterium]
MQKKTLLITSYLLLVFLSLSQVLYSQKAKITGTITDSRNNETIIGVTIMADSSGVGTVTDVLGKFILEVEPGKHILRFSYLGFTQETREINAVAGTSQEINIQMKSEQKELKLVTVTGSQYEKDAAKEVVSIDVIKKYLVENTNAPDLAKAVEKVPGVTIVDGQASIRGGSGYAYGTGSRVQVLVDDMPMLTGDLSEVRWNFVPIENMEQVEVIKGAASSLYGSGAMNGVIHVRTGYAYDKPQTKISIAQGVYSNPARKELRWWDNFFNPFFTNAFLSHRQKFGNIDLIIGGNLNWSSGYLKNGSDQQARVNFKTRWRPKKLKYFSFELAGNAMYQQFGRFFLWQDPDAGALTPWEGTLSEDKYSYFTIDPRISYSGPNGAIHKIRSRYYKVTRYSGSNNKTTASTDLFWGDYQFQKQFDFGLSLTSGAIGSYSNSYSSLYEGMKLKQLFMAGYLQLEQEFKEKLTLLLGARYERNHVFGLPNDPGRPVFRAGINYKVGKATFLRTNWGQGYRFPSLGERYIDASLSSIKIFPNPSLKPESGWTSELAVKQGYKFGNFMGYLDMALFWYEFKDMIEYVFLIDPEKGFGFQAKNISRARIAGAEISTIADGKILGIPVRLFAGYTFNYPADLESDTAQRKANIFIQNLFQSIGKPDSLLATSSILKYRLRNTARADLEFEPFKKILIGGTCTYNSFMERIDLIFDQLNGISKYRESHKKGILVFDMRFAYKLSDRSTISLIVKNISNQEYSLRPGLLEAPRSFTLQYKLQF